MPPHREAFAFKSIAVLCTFIPLEQLSKSSCYEPVNHYHRIIISGIPVTH